MARIRARTRVQRMGVKAAGMVDGKKIPMIRFTSDIVGGTVIGMIEALRDIKPTWKLIDIFVMRSIESQTYHQPYRTAIKIDGKLLPVGGFVSDWVSKIIIAMIEILTIDEKFLLDPNWKVIGIRVERRTYY